MTAHRQRRFAITADSHIPGEGQHASRLESDYRMVTHQLRQPLGTLQFGLKMLSTDEGWKS